MMDHFEAKARGIIGRMMFRPASAPATGCEAWAVCYVAVPALEGDISLWRKVAGRPVGKVIELHDELKDMRPEQRTTRIRRFSKEFKELRPSGRGD